MNPSRRARVRRALKWAGVLLCAVILVAWLISVRYWVHWVAEDHSGEYMLASGKLTYIPSSPPSLGFRGFMYIRRRPAEKGTPWWTTRVTRTHFLIPLAWPFLIIVAPTALLFWRDRHRIPPGHCQSCGYDLTGNESGVCPECGTACQVQEGKQ